ncbi:hypothetical protein [Sorangium sp. So ce1335]|uniref:hypothetical protein n=1 Tax=Sorangium sp. So ce1335 TaxID=3133335 RepID=UPI003F635210
MEEWLAIRIGGRGSWIDKPDYLKCASDLKPREKEDKKSAWAYVVDKPISPMVAMRLAFRVGSMGRSLGNVASALLSKLSPDATLELQAIALLLFLMMGSRSASPPGQVWILSFKRTQVDPKLVANEDAQHIVPAYDHTHRGLDTANVQVRQALARKLIEGRYRHAYDVRDFTLDELKPLLKQLLLSNLIRDEHVENAKLMLGDFL